jgi:hypothetical protein
VVLRCGQTGRVVLSFSLAGALELEIIHQSEQLRLRLSMLWQSDDSGPPQFCIGFLLTSVDINLLLVWQYSFVDKPGLVKGKLGCTAFHRQVRFGDTSLN